MVQALILAAGNGTRLRPLTETKPKPLLRVGNTKPLLHNFDQLPKEISEVILVVKPSDKMIKREIGDKYKWMKVKYVFQKEQKGTGDAALQAKDFIKDKFLMLMGDDLYDRNDIKNCMKKCPSIALKRVYNPSSFGIVETKGQKAISLIEKPKNPKSNLANLGLYFLDTSVFKHNIKVCKARGECEFTDAIIGLINDKKLYFSLAKTWMPISYSWNLLDANEFLLKKIPKKIMGKVERGATLKGKVHIGKGTVVKSGSYIEGPVFIGEGCKIGPNCFIRPTTSIGNNCHIGHACEVKNVILGDNSNIPHLNYVADSVIGNNCNLAAGTITANFRHDEENVKSMVKRELVDTGRKKLGTIIGDNVKTGINTLIYPGRKIWPGKTTLPGEIVRKDAD